MTVANSLDTSSARLIVYCTPTAPTLCFISIVLLFLPTGATPAPILTIAPGTTLAPGATWAPNLTRETPTLAPGATLAPGSTLTPSMAPFAPSDGPSSSPTGSPTGAATSSPSGAPTGAPTINPTASPTVAIAEDDEEGSLSGSITIVSEEEPECVETDTCEEVVREGLESSLGRIGTINVTDVVVTPSSADSGRRVLFVASSSNLRGGNGIGSNRWLQEAATNETVTEIDYVSGPDPSSNLTESQQAAEQINALAETGIADLLEDLGLPPDSEVELGTTKYTQCEFYVFFFFFCLPPWVVGMVLDGCMMKFDEKQTSESTVLRLVYSGCVFITFAREFCV